MFVKSRINHILHLILTVITLSVWAFVWVALGIINTARGMRCSECGMKMGTLPAPAASMQDPGLKTPRRPPPPSRRSQPPPPPPPTEESKPDPS